MTKWRFIVYNYNTILVFYRDPESPLPKKIQNLLVVFHEWWNCGTDRKFNPSTWQRKGSRGQEGGLQRSTSEKTEMSFKLATESPQNKKTTKKRRKKTRCSKSIVERSIGFFFWCGFFVHQCACLHIIVLHLNQCVYYIPLAQSFMTQNLPSTNPQERSSDH